jgi:hypothetical protein
MKGLSTMTGDPWQLPHQGEHRLPRTLRERLFHLIDAASFQASSYSASAAAAVLSAGWRPPTEPVTTVAELLVLPQLSVIVDAGGKAWQAGINDSYDVETDTYARIWHPAGMDTWTESTEELLPARVVWRP